MTQDSIEIYRKAWHDRYEKQRQQMEDRRKLLRFLAEKVADVLKTEYHISNIFLIGSIVWKKVITNHSDIDLAAEGIPPAKYFSILSRLSEELPYDVNLDLITLESVQPSFKQRILKEGVKL